MKQETPGQIFQKYRQAEKLKISQVEKDTRISAKMLIAMENDDYQNLPEDFYAKNLIKTYASYLNLDYNKLLALYDKNKVSNGPAPKPEYAKPIKVYLTPQLVKNISLVLLVLALLGYMGWQLNKIYKPPFLEVYQPDKNVIIAENYIEIKGNTEKEALVYINDKEVFIDSQGAFSAELDLQKGLNLLKISAVKKHSKENTVYREILVQ